MRVLFLHQHFPGPFRHLAVRLGSLPDTTVLFLSERGRREVRLPKVRRLGVASPRVSEEGEPAEREMNTALRRAANTANALLRLRRDGFVPDLVYAASGPGNGLYVRDIFPEAAYAVHADWYHTKGRGFTFFTGGKPRPAVEFAPGRIRNLFQLNALAECDLAVASSAWQRDQYPSFLAERIHTLHEGVDAAFFSPRKEAGFVADGCDLSTGAEVVTFSGRGALRGLPQLCRALPRLLAERPRCRVLIMTSGQGGRAGGEHEMPAPLAALVASLRAERPEAAARIHVFGFLAPEAYRSLLRASTVHIYLTAPFALSQGLFEALSCGCLVLGSGTEPVREVVRHGENGFLCDFWDADRLADMAAALLRRSRDMEAVRLAARETILARYDARKLLPRHLKLLSDAVARRKQA